MPTSEKNLYKLHLAALAVIIAAALFVFPDKVKATLDLPVTDCGNTHHDLIVNNFSVHLSSTSEPETGQHAFIYGPDNNSFASRNGDIVSFNAVPVFTPSATATIKAYALNQNCGVVFGFGPQYTGNLTANDNLFSIDLAPNQFGGRTAFFKDETQFFFVSSQPRYIWIEVWDGISGSEFASYSYLVDVENIQNPTGQVGEGSTRHPVLIVPGILGTELFDEGEFIWPDLFRMIGSDQFLLDHLSLSDEGESQNFIETGDIVRRMNIVIFPLIFEIDVNIFDSLISVLVTSGFQEANDLFVFPYDWRIDLDNSADKLNQRIDEIKQITGTDKVDIVAHSMGGLVTKNYIEHFGDSSVDKLVFVGTPHLGAPKAGKSLLVGEKFNIGLLDSQVMKELAKNSPAVYQLLPNPTYFQNFMGYIFPSLKNILKYNETREFLADKELNEFLLANADSFFERDLHNLNYGNIDAYNIAGCSLSTQAVYVYDQSKDKIINIGYASGDETVPLVSADYIDIPNNKKFYAEQSKHSRLPSLPGVRELITGILRENISLASNVSNNQDICSFAGKRLVWRSPVEVHIYDSSGNHTGPIENNIIENSVPGVGYDIIDGEKFVYLPTDEGQEYTIEAKGLEQGKFDLLISEDDNGITGKTYVFDNVEITASTKVEFNISENSQDNIIQIDFFGNNNFQPYLTDVELENEVQLNDTTPPEFLINFNLEEGKIVFSAIDNTDPDTTVVCANTSCTAEDWAGNKTTINFLYRNLGSQHTLDLQSIVYNNEQAQTIEGNLVVHYIESRGILRGFAQTFYKERNRFTRVNYNQRKDESTITEHNNGVTRKNEQGIKFLQVGTEEGIINLSY